MGIARADLALKRPAIRWEGGNPIWDEADTPSPKHISRIERAGTRDDMCSAVRDLRRLHVFERTIGEGLRDATRAMRERAGLPAPISTVSATGGDPQGPGDTNSEHAERCRARAGQGSEEPLLSSLPPLQQEVDHVGYLSADLPESRVKDNTGAVIARRMDRIERALNRVPALMAIRRVKEQIASDGLRALDHIEVQALAHREAYERDRLMEYVNVAATHPRLRDFEAWAEFLDEGKIGKREPQDISVEQVDDIYRTVLEPLAALYAAAAWGNGTQVSLGNDLIKESDPSRAGLPSFDLSVLGADGTIRSNVEVTSALSGVRKPNDLARAIEHGIKKSRKSPSNRRAGSREVSVAVRWFKGRVAVDGGLAVDEIRSHHKPEGNGEPVDPNYVDSNGHYIAVGKHYIEYLGDGTYRMWERTASPGKRSDVFLYRRNIVIDDLPHYLQRHRDVCKWLDAVSIFNPDGQGFRYHITRRGSVWDVQALDSVDSELASRRANRRRLRQWVREPLEGVEGPAFQG